LTKPFYTFRDKCGQSLSYTIEVPSLWEVPEIAEYLDEDGTVVPFGLQGMARERCGKRGEFIDNAIETVRTPMAELLTIQNNLRFPYRPSEEGCYTQYPERSAIIPKRPFTWPAAIATRKQHDTMLTTRQTRKTAPGLRQQDALLPKANVLRKTIKTSSIQLSLTRHGVGREDGAGPSSQVQDRENMA
jgi:hypothetical protein